MEKAIVHWTLYSDRRFFEDESGFYDECYNETTIFSYMDILGNAIILFQNMNAEEGVQFRVKAKEIACRRKPQYNYLYNSFALEWFVLLKRT